MSNSSSVTFVIPIYNSTHFLPACFDSIKKQNYPKEKIEVICPDGGSKDNSAEVASKLGGKVIKNSKVLAEPGFMLGAKKARGELIVYMGADNILVEKDWIKKMVKPFEDKEILGAYPRLRSKKENTWLTKYFNAFTDPINHFVMGNACNPVSFSRKYKILKKTRDYEVYDFKIKDYPILALDQGFMLRKSYKRRKDTEYDDILPVLDMIKDKKQLAYVSGASSYHDTLERGLPQFIKKMRWGVDNNLTPNGTLGYKKREEHSNILRKLKLYIWPLYAASIFLPIAHSVIGYINDGREEWKYHTQITLIMLGIVLFEIVRVKLLRRPSLAQRY